MKILRSTCLATISLCFLGSASAYAQQEDDQTFEMNTITCRDLFKMPNEERDFTLIFFHGLLSGKNAEMVFDGPAMMDATDRIVDYCIDNSQDSLLGVFERIRS